MIMESLIANATLWGLALDMRAISTGMKPSPRPSAPPAAGSSPLTYSKWPFALVCLPLWLLHPQQPASRQTLHRALSNSTSAITGLCCHRKSGGAFSFPWTMWEAVWATPGLQLKTVFTIFLELVHPHRRLRTQPIATQTLSKTFFL